MYTDLAGAVALPFYIIAAGCDLRSRMIPAAVWPIPLVIGLTAAIASGLVLQAAVSAVVVTPAALVLIARNQIGVGDAKAITVLCAAFPVAPSTSIAVTVPFIQLPFAAQVTVSAAVLSAIWVWGQKLLSQSPECDNTVPFAAPLLIALLFGCIVHVA